MALISRHSSLSMDTKILKECHHKLCVEHKRLTAKGLAIEYSIPRKTATDLLEELPYFDVSQDRTYDITRCVLEQKESKIGKCVCDILLNKIIYDCYYNLRQN